MKREIILIDITKKSDTIKSQESKDYENYGPIVIEMLSNSEFFMKISMIYYDESLKKMYLKFEVQNRTDRNISLKFGELEVDKTRFDLSYLKPERIKSKSSTTLFTKSVKYMFLQSGINMEVDFVDMDNNEIFKSYYFKMKIYD